MRLVGLAVLPIDLAGDRNEGRDKRRVEMATGVLFDPGQRVVDRPGLLAGTPRGERVAGVGNGEDARDATTLAFSPRATRFTMTRRGKMR